MTERDTGQRTKEPKTVKAKGAVTGTSLKREKEAPSARNTNTNLLEIQRLHTKGEKDTLVNQTNKPGVLI